MLTAEPLAPAFERAPGLLFAGSASPSAALDNTRALFRARATIAFQANRLLPLKNDDEAALWVRRTTRAARPPHWPMPPPLS